MKQSILLSILLILTACATSPKKEDPSTPAQPNIAKCSSEKQTISCVWDKVNQ